MKKQMIRNFLPGMLMLGAVVFLSSCNRGYGCPNNFSLNDTVVEIVGSVLNLFF